MWRNSSQQARAPACPPVSPRRSWPRVSRLAEPIPAVLHEAAVLGVDIDDELLAAVSHRPDVEVAAALREAAAAQLLVIGESGCRFRHALTREALYDDLLPGERARLHLAAARALQQKRDRKSTRLNSSHPSISYAVF